MVGQHHVGLLMVNLMIQRQAPDRVSRQGASGLTAQTGGAMRRLAEFPHVGISNSGGGLPYGIPPCWRSKSTGHSRRRKLRGCAVHWRDRVRFGRMLASGGAFIAFARTRTSGFAE